MRKKKFCQKDESKAGFNFRYSPPCPITPAPPPQLWKLQLYLFSFFPSYQCVFHTPALFCKCLIFEELKKKKTITTKKKTAPQELFLLVFRNLLEARSLSVPWRDVPSDVFQCSLVLCCFLLIAPHLPPPPPHPQKRQQKHFRGASGRLSSFHLRQLLRSSCLTCCVFRPFPITLGAPVHVLLCVLLFTLKCQTADLLKAKSAPTVFYIISFNQDDSPLKMSQIDRWHRRG